MMPVGKMANRAETMYCTKCSPQGVKLCRFWLGGKSVAVVIIKDDRAESNDRHSRIPRMRNECKQPRRDKCASVSGILTNPPGEESASNDKVEVTTVMRLNSHKLDMLLPSWEQRESDKWQGFISTPCTIGLCYTTVNDSRVEGYEISGYFQSPGPSVGYANPS
ncbi:hypothetical protein RRG08_030395 [Elysia crispata]|uniref:Uncharacterized protein n=1 Tax=Elysia crispata TaxID=231223 RepID=A0AAE0YFS2_9GAST|nr:hypothetical protein RRG08_030395 [Elysia crispata]